MNRNHYVPLFESVTHSERLADCKLPDVRFFYCCLLTKCDQWGRAIARVRVIHKEVWSMFGPVEDVGPYLEELARHELVLLYEVDGEPYLWVPDWEEKAGRVGQGVRRAPSAFPDPPAELAHRLQGYRPSVKPREDSQAGSTPRDPSRPLETPREGSGDSRNPSSRARTRARVPTEKREEEPRGEEPPSAASRPGVVVEVEWWHPIFAEFPTLATPEAVDAFREIIRTREVRKDAPWDAERLRGQLSAFLESGPAGWIEAVSRTVRNRYKGIVVPSAPSRAGHATGLAAVAKLRSESDR